MHQINNEKSLLRLYTRPKCLVFSISRSPIFDDYILHKNCEGMMVDTACLMHNLPKYYKFSKFGTKLFCELMEYFISAKDKKLYYEKFENENVNISCLTQLCCYSKRVNLCSGCNLSFIVSTNGMCTFFKTIGIITKLLALMDHKKIIPTIYGLIMIVRILSNFISYPLIMRYIFSFPIFYRKLYKFWMNLNFYIWNFKKNKHKLKHLKLDKDLVAMIITNLKSFQFGPIDHDEMQIFAINTNRNNNNYLLVTFLFDLISHLLNDFIHYSSKYWNNQHFEYLLHSLDINIFIKIWFVHEFDINYNKFTYSYLTKNCNMRYLKQYLNGNLINKNRSIFENQLLLAYKTILYDSKYIMEIWRLTAYRYGKCMFRGGIANGITNLNKGNVKAKRIFLEGLRLQLQNFTELHECMTSSPFARKFKKCKQCGKKKENKNHKFYICKRCKFVMYCSRKCQKIDWNKSNHRNLCSKLRIYSDDTRRFALERQSYGI